MTPPIRTDADRDALWQAVQGAITVGGDADLVVIDPERERTISRPVGIVEA